VRLCCRAGTRSKTEIMMAKKGLKCNDWRKMMAVCDVASLLDKMCSFVSTVFTLKSVSKTPQLWWFRIVCVAFSNCWILLSLKFICYAPCYFVNTSCMCQLPWLFSETRVVFSYIAALASLRYVQKWTAEIDCPCFS